MSCAELESRGAMTLVLEEGFFLVVVVVVVVAAATVNGITITHTHSQSMSVQGDGWTKWRSMPMHIPPTLTLDRPVLGDGDDDDSGNKYGLFAPWIRDSEGKGLSSPPAGLLFFGLSLILAGGGPSAKAGERLAFSRTDCKDGITRVSD